MAILKPGDLSKHSFNPDACYATYRNIAAPELYSLDICLIDKNKNGLSGQWLHQLLKAGKSEIDFEARPEALPGIFHLFFENRNFLNLKGQRTFAFGYPLYIEKQAPAHHSIVAPLFIWHLDIRPTEPGKWTIRHDEHLAVQANTYLLHYLKTKYDLNLDGLCHSLCNSRQLNSISIAKVCHQLAAGLSVKFPGDLEIEPFLKAFAPIKTNAPNILKSGFFGVFPGQGNPFQRKDKTSAPPPPNLYSPQHAFSLSATNPFQSKAIRAAFDHRIVSVEGARGSGRAFTLANLLITALANGQKCLVVSDHMKTTRYLQSFFNRHHLENYCLSFTDPFYDLPELITKIRTKPVQNKDFDQERYRFLVNKTKRTEQKLLEQYKAVQQPVFAHKNWQDIVGKFLSSNREEGKELLNSQLNPFDFDFIVPEYESMKKAVKLSRQLFHRINTFAHPLRYLHRNIFLNLDKNEALFFTEEHLAKFQAKARALHHRYILKQDDYTRKLRDHYERHYRELYSKLELIRENIDDATELYGEDFIESGLSLKVYGVFSNRAKNILQARSQINAEYLELKQEFEKREYFHFDFYENVETKNIYRINSQLEGLEDGLQQWRSDLNAKVLEEAQRLSNKTVHPSLDYQEQIHELEYALDLLIEELNTTQIYEQPLQNKMLTIPMRQQFLEGLIDQLDETQNNLRDFDAFYDWNQCWMSLPAITQKLIRAIVKVKPRNWMAAFESWYFYHLLYKHYGNRLPQDNRLFQNFSEAWKQLSEMLPGQVSDLWNQRKQLSTKQLKKNDKATYQLLFKSSPATYSQNSFDGYFQNAFETITDHFPVVLAAPSVAEKILSFDSAYFDFTGVYIAGQQASAKWLNVRNKTNHLAFFTDVDLPAEHLSQPPVYQHAQRISLPVVHSGRNQLLGNFLNAALYNGKLVMNNELQAEEGAIEIYFAKGRYQSGPETNKKEAEFILDQIEQARKNNGKDNIKVACATVNQRNLISRMLLETGKETAETTGVYTFQELMGLEADVFLVSMVYTKIPYQSGRQQSFNYSTPAYKWRLLFSVSTHRFILCHSFTEEQVDDFSKQSKDKAPFLLAQFIRYAQACQSDNSGLKNEILHSFQKNPEKTPEAIINAFLDEIALALTPYFETGRICRNLEHKGFLIPLAILPEYQDKPVIAILQDGFLQMPPAPSFPWEYQIRKKLHVADIKTYAVWSVNWWKNPKLEARKLASAVIKMSSS